MGPSALPALPSLGMCGMALMSVVLAILVLYKIDVDVLILEKHVMRMTKEE